MSTVNGHIDIAPGRKPHTDPGGVVADNTPRDPTRNTYCTEATTPDDVSDMIASFVEVHGESARVEFARQNASLGFDYIGSFAASQCSLDTIAGRYGPGRYRVVVKSGNNANQRRGRYISIAGEPQASPPPAPAAPVPVSPATAAPSPDRLARLESLVEALAMRVMSAPPAAAPSPVASSPLNLTEIIVAQMKQQGDLLTAMLTKQAEKSTESPKVSELTQLFKLFRSAGAGEGESGGGVGGLLQEAISGVVAGLRSPVPASAPAAPARRPLPVRPLNHPGGLPRPRVAPVVAVPHPGHSPSVPDFRPVPAESAPPPSGALEGAGVTEGESEPYADPDPMNPIAALVAAKVRNNPEARRVAGLIRGDDKTDPEPVAEMIVSVMDDAQVSHLLASELGSWAGLFLAGFPDLAAHRDFVFAVETEVRSKLADDAPAATDAHADAQADDVAGDTNPERTPA